MKLRTKHIIEDIVAFAALAALVLFVAFLVSGGCSAPSSRTSQTGQGNKTTNDQSQAFARIDQLLVRMDASFKLLEALKIEARAGTQEAADHSTTGRDSTKTTAQQQGLWNISFQDAVTGGGIGFGVLTLSILMYSMRKGVRELRAMEARENELENFNESLRAWNHDNAMLLMAGKQAQDAQTMPTPPSFPCSRGWWPWSRCSEQTKQNAQACGRAAP